MMMVVMMMMIMMMKMMVVIMMMMTMIMMMMMIFLIYTTIHSDQKITFCIRHRYLRHPSCKHKTIWRKIILLYWTICLEQSAFITPPLGFFFIIQTRS